MLLRTATSLCRTVQHLGLFWSVSVSFENGRNSRCMHGRVTGGAAAPVKVLCCIVSRSVCTPKETYLASKRLPLSEKEMDNRYKNKMYKYHIVRNSITLRARVTVTRRLYIGVHLCSLACKGTLAVDV